ncbi:unnamed protein product [Brassicogethes aeneus]|uniref:Uncharacterized protein n=1 Tax=Brassicogethes aeneus TaxID=1431903 RepID=A0A9P0B0B4_BRAAE|nr:unnamed protein product [Brassicogethes aeneus]
MEEKQQDIEDFMTEITAVMVKIYSSCDVEVTDSVKVSQLIDFIKPYFNEELTRLECLRQTLDPDNNDVSVSSETFYKAMTDWAKKMSSEEANESFCGSPCRLDNIDKEMLYNQSTPRTSFGQKLLNGSLELLNLSNVSSYSTNGSKTMGADATLYEERIKMLQFEIGKSKSEMALMRNQLTNFEELNECLQLDIVKTNKKLHAEQLEKENLVQQIRELEELKDELISYRKKIDELMRQKNSTEKENEKLSNRVKEIEEAREKLDRKNEESFKKEQELKNKLYAIKVDLDCKETEILELNQLNDNLKNHLNQNRELISCMESEIEELKVYRQGHENARQNQLNSPSFIYKNLLEAFSNYPTYTSNDFSPPQRPITPPTNTMSPIPIWRAKSTENLSLQLENGNGLNLRRQVLTKSASATNNANRSLIFSEEGAGDGDQFFMDADDSFTRHQEFLKIIDTQFNKRDSLQAEFSKVKDGFGCKCRLTIEEKDKIIGDLKEMLDDHRNISEKLAVLEEKNASLRMEKLDLQKNLCEVEVTLADLESAKSDMEYDLFKATTEIKNVKTERDQVSFDKVLMENKIKLMDRDVKALREAIEAKTLEIESLKEKTCELEKYLFFEDLSKKLEEKINEKNEALKCLEEDNKRLKRNLENFTCKTTEEKNSALKLLTNEIDDLKDALEKKNVEIAELLENIKSTADWKKLLQDKLQGEIYEKNLKLQNLLDENERLKSNVTDLKTQLSLAVDNKEELSNVNSRIMETMKQLEDHLSQKSLLVAGLMEIKEKLAQSLLQAEQAVENKMTEVLRLKDRLQKDLSLKNDLWVEIKKLEGENRDLKVQSEEMAKQRDSFKEKYTDKSDIVKNQEALLKSLEKKIEEEQEKNLSVRVLEIDVKEKDRKILLLESHKERHLEAKKELEENNNTIDKVVDKLAKMFEEDLNGLMRLQKLENLAVKCENNNNLSIKIVEKLSKGKNIDLLEGSPMEKIQALVEELSKRQKESVEELEKLRTSREFAKSRMKKEDSVKKTSSETSLHKNNFGKQQVKIDRLEERLDVTLKRLDASERKCKESEKTLKELMKLKNDYEEMLKAKSEELMRLKNESAEVLKAKSEELMQLNNESKEVEEKLTDLEKQLEKNLVDLKNLQADKNIAEQRLMLRGKETADLYANYSDLKRRFDENRTALRDLETQNAQLTQEKYSLMSEEDSLREQLCKARRDLAEVSGKSEDLKSLNEAEEKLKGTVGLLKTSEMELNCVKGKVDRLREEVLKFDEQMKGRNGVLLSGRQELGRILVKVLNVLRKTDDLLSYNENYDKLFNEVTAGNFNENTADVEVEVKKLGKQIKVAVFLLEIVAIRFPKHMDLNDATNSEAEQVDNRFLVPDGSHNKVLKRFTLRPGRLIASRPMSPDSPSLDVEDAELNLNENKNPESPDSDAVKCESWMKSFEESFDTADGDHSHYFNKLDDLENFCSDIDLQQPFPNVTDLFLEKLGLHETSELTNFSKEETENLFTTLVIQLAIDSKDYPERRLKQKEQCIEVHDKMLKLLKEINFRLRDHKCIGASDSIKPIFIIVEEARQLVQLVATSCAQYGVVSYEGRMTKCWNLVTNYTAQLRQVQSQSTVKMVDSPTQTARMRKESSRDRRSLERVAQETREVTRPPLPRNACAIL